MKYLSLLKLVVFLLLSQQLFAQIAPRASYNVEQRRFQELHLRTCSTGVPGWWVKLDSYIYNPGVSGYININTGAFYGCGDCPKCRNDLNKNIDSLLESEKARCLSRGGTVKSLFRGDWSEDIRQTQWQMMSKGVSLVCEKWIPCSSKYRLNPRP